MMDCSWVRLIVCLLCWATAASANSLLTGKVTKVRDGDTIVVVDQPVRLAALDCPEKGKFGGEAATNLMKRLTDGVTVTCELDGTTTYDRVVGYCSARGRDLGQQMIDAEVCGIYQKYNTEGRY